MLSNLKRRLKASFKNSLAQCNIKMIRKSTNRLSSLFRFIFVTPKELESHIVCKFLCGSCNNTYYGRTLCHFNVRSGEHLALSHLTGKRVECNPSAVSGHLLQYNHDSDCNDFTILCGDNNGFRFLL